MTGMGHPQYRCRLTPQSRRRYWTFPLPIPFSSKYAVIFLFPSSLGMPVNGPEPTMRPGPSTAALMVAGGTPPPPGVLPPLSGRKERGERADGSSQLADLGLPPRLPGEREDERVLGRHAHERRPADRVGARGENGDRHLPVLQRDIDI